MWMQDITQTYLLCGRDEDIFQFLCTPKETYSIAY